LAPRRIMITLVIETSTPRGSVALFDGSALLFSEAFEAGRSHSAQLFGVLERALCGRQRVGRVAVGLGPGSYAGVRIAISAAIGYSVAGGAELAGLPSIIALDDGDYVALGDARRESYYFAVVRQGECVEGPLLVPAEELPAKLAWAQAQKLPVFSSELLPTAPESQLRFPCAERLGRSIAAGKPMVVGETLEPIYLREPHITQPKR